MFDFSFGVRGTLSHGQLIITFISEAKELDSEKS